MSTATARVGVRRRASASVFHFANPHLGARQGGEHFEAKDVRVVVNGTAQVRHPQRDRQYLLPPTLDGRHGLEPVPVGPDDEGRLLALVVLARHWCRKWWEVAESGWKVGGKWVESGWKKGGK